MDLITRIMKKNYLTLFLGGSAILMVLVYLFDILISAIGASCWSREGDKIVDAGGSSEFWFPWSQVWTPVTIVIIIALIVLFFVELFYKNNSQTQGNQSQGQTHWLYTYSCLLFEYTGCNAVVYTFFYEKRLLLKI